MCLFVCLVFLLVLKYTYKKAKIRVFPCLFGVEEGHYFSDQHDSFCHHDFPFCSS